MTLKCHLLSYGRKQQESNTVTMPDLKFYKFNGTDWVKIDQEVVIDTNILIMMRVRIYKHYDTYYTVMACADYNKPMHMYYKIETDTPNGEDIKKSDNQIMKHLKKLMARSPITEAELLLTEKKLFSKLTEKRLQVLEEMKQQHKIEMELKRRQNEYIRRMQNIKAFFQSRPRYVKGTYTAKSVEEEVARKKKEIEEKRKAAARVIVTDDDNDSIFGIFSIYRNSEIHGEYYPDE